MSEKSGSDTIAGAGTSAELRQMLFREIEDVQSGKVSLYHGNTVARLAAQVINCVFADIAMMRNQAALDERTAKLIEYNDETDQG